MLAPTLLASNKIAYSSALALGMVALTVDPSVFAAAVVTIITSIAGAVILIINALTKAKLDILGKNAELALTGDHLKKQLMDRQAELLAKADVIQGHVDGMSTSAAAKRTADEDTITSLRQQLADSENRATLLAQAKANVDIATAVPFRVFGTTTPRTIVSSL